jgi:hypothetical protein
VLGVESGQGTEEDPMSGPGLSVAEGEKARTGSGVSDDGPWARSGARPKGFPRPFFPFFFVLFFFFS